MSIQTTLYPLIYRCKLLLGDTATGIQDQKFEIALTDNRVYHYREKMQPLDTLQIEDSAYYGPRPNWYTYVSHNVWKALHNHWSSDASFVNYDGDTITPQSFDSEIGVTTFTTAERDVRITGYSYSVYRSCLYVIHYVLADKTAYYNYTTDGGSQNEREWFENLLSLSTQFERMAETST